MKMDMTSDGINVIYKVVDGMHFFVPADKKALGLCVANTDLETAYNEVGEQLSIIDSFNSGEKGTSYVPAIPFDEFKKIIAAFDAVTNLASGGIVPNPVQSWTHTKNMEFA
jgi:hypothetical protein